MRKLTLLLIGILLTLTATGQSHIFENNTENKDIGDGFGQWVNSKYNVQVTNKGGGVYDIKIYSYDKSLPETELRVKYYSRIGIGTGGWYGYKPFQSNTIRVKSTIKLSLMAQGHEGIINIFIGLTEVSWVWDCRNY